MQELPVGQELCFGEMPVQTGHEGTAEVNLLAGNSQMTGEKPEVLIENGGKSLTTELTRLHSVPNQSAVLPSQGAFQNLKCSHAMP